MCFQLALDECCDLGEREQNPPAEHDAFHPLLRSVRSADLASLALSRRTVAASSGVITAGGGFPSGMCGVSVIGGFRSMKTGR